MEVGHDFDMAPGQVRTILLDTGISELSSGGSLISLKMTA